MDFELDEGQKGLQKAAREFLQNECPEQFVRAMEKDNKGYSPELWHKIARLGWLGMVYPEKHGGAGGTVMDLAVLHEEMGRAMFPGPFLSTVVLCGLTIMSAGNEGQKAELLPCIANGDLVLALALTEPDVSWDADGVTVSATADGDYYVIDGTKLFVHDAHIADYFLCVARTRKRGKAENGITLFLVDAKNPGIHCTLLKTAMGNNKQSEVVFDRVRVHKKNVVGELDKGWAPLTMAIQLGAVLICAEMVGATKKLLEITVDYAKTRVQFDQPIGVNQYVQEHCVYLMSYARSSEFVTYQAAWKISEGIPHDYEVAVAKAWTSEAHRQACWRCHQVFAGIGSASDLSLPPLYTRRALTNCLYLGDGKFWRRKVAKQMDKWTVEVPKGKRLGIFEKEQVPAWTR